MVFYPLDSMSGGLWTGIVAIAGLLSTCLVMLIRDYVRLESRVGHAEHRAKERLEEIDVLNDRLAERERRLAIKSEAEARSTADEAKSRFLATVSHEMRTPLNGVLGMAGLLVDTKLDPEQATYVKAIKTSGESLLTLIDEILDFSKVESGKLEMSRVAFDIRDLIEGVIELIAPKAQVKGLEISAFIESAVPAQIISDAARFRQVLVNLLGNAVKFTEVGGVTLVAEMRERALHIRVIDTGPGIAPADQERIFTEFVRGDEAATARHEGAGLGLAISRRLAATLGGRLELASGGTRGATFAFVFPCDGAAAGASAAPTVKTGAGTVLLVGRGPFELDHADRQLVALGFVVERAFDEMDALDLLNALDAPRAMLVDAALGVEICKRLAAAARAVRTQRVIVLLTPYERRNLGSPTTAGFDGWLVKPLRPRSLAARLIEDMQAKEPPVATAGRANRFTPRRAGSPRPAVLIAEDNEINALLAMRQIEKVGARPVWAKNGLEALGLLEQALTGEREAFAGAFFDLRMPGMDGRELVRRLREIEQRASRPRLMAVALTASAFPEERADCLAAGFDDFLIKPLDVDRLQTMVARWIESADFAGRQRVAG